MSEKYVEEMSAQEMNAYEAHLRDYLSYLARETQKSRDRLELIKNVRGKNLES